MVASSLKESSTILLGTGFALTCLIGISFSISFCPQMISSRSGRKSSKTKAVEMSVDRDCSAMGEVFEVILSADDCCS